MKQHLTKREQIKKRDRKLDREQRAAYLQTMVSAYDVALLDKLDEQATAEFLQLLRAGDEDASEVLRKGHVYLVYEVAIKLENSRSKLRLVDVVGPFFDSFTDIIAGLRKTERDDVEKLIRDELARTLQDLRRAESLDLHVPSSTKSDRKKIGKSPYKKLTRVDSVQQASEGSSPEDEHTPQLHEYPAIGPGETQKGEPRPIPSCMTNQNEAQQIFELEDAYCRDDVERGVFRGLMANMTEREMANELSTTVHKVKEAVGKIAARLATDGLTPSAVPAGNVTTATVVPAVDAGHFELAAEFAISS